MQLLGHENIIFRQGVKLYDTKMCLRLYDGTNMFSEK